MAASESDVTTENLSKNLPVNDNDIKPSVCEKEELDSGCKSIQETHSENVDLKSEAREERSGNEELFNMKQEGRENCAEVAEADGDFKDCINSEFINSSDGSKRQSRPPRMPTNKAVDVALLEEDEDNIELSDEEDNYESAEEEHLTPEEAEERKNIAMELKTKGNDHFRNQEYVEGKDCYSQAIKKCPKEFPDNKSIFYANRAACSQKMEDYEAAINDCSKALELAPSYLKARLRRAQCFEKADKLEEALEDYKVVFENDRSCQTAREAIIRLPEEIKVKHEKLKEEMIGKLKDLGNMVLRPFGLSTDNFQLQQDPNSGGYSINFQK